MESHVCPLCAGQGMESHVCPLCAGQGMESHVCPLCAGQGMDIDSQSPAPYVLQGKDL